MVEQVNGSPSQAEYAYLALRDRIVSLQLPPGAPVHEDVLTAEIGTGRTPFREAVKRLERESLIVIYPRRGSFVTEVNISDHTLIADVRLRLEGLGARRAAEWATPEERAELAELRSLVESSPAGQAPIMDVDTRVHRMLYRCTHNPYLRSTLDEHYNLALRIWCLFFDRLRDVRSHVSEHSALIDAVVNGEADTADQLAVDHVHHFQDAIRSVL